MDEKQIAAESAEQIKNGMVTGFGSGSTAEISIRILGDKMKTARRL